MAYNFDVYRLSRLGVRDDTDPNDPSTWSAELTLNHAKHLEKMRQNNPALYAKIGPKFTSRAENITQIKNKSNNGLITGPYETDPEKIRSLFKIKTNEFGHKIANYTSPKPLVEGLPIDKLRAKVAPIYANPDGSWSKDEIQSKFFENGKPKQNALEYNSFGKIGSFHHISGHFGHHTDPIQLSMNDSFETHLDNLVQGIAKRNSQFNEHYLAVGNNLKVLPRQENKYD
jgi:hypothetical protein